MLTRRVRNRTFLLRPCERTNQIVQYVAATMAKQWNIEIHAIVVMSNHWHVCLTDPDGRIVEFQRDCHHFITRGVNAHHGELESIWSSAAPSRVECDAPDDLLREFAYTMANPVRAGLVRFGKDWPGVRRAWPSKPKLIKRPPKFFRGEEKGGEWPDEVVLEFARPPGFDELSDEEFADVIAAAIEHREGQFRKERDDAKAPFMGRRQVLRQSRHSHSRSREARFGISPKLACHDKGRRIERLQANRRWLESYRAALAAWRAGLRDVEFPLGTYQMRVLHGVRCVRAPD